jgi:hypothetical protein
MLDEMERLRQQPLRGLLECYAQAAQPDREAWQDRQMELDGLTARDLSRLHGELLAFGWLEQNTGAAVPLQGGAARLCYRVTAQGLKALRTVAKEEAALETEAALA